MNRADTGTPAARRRLSCSAEELFAVLADGWLYPLWVVGASRMREVDASWPTQGAKLHHSFGAWPALIDDKTTLLEWEPYRRAVLEAEGWPLGSARVVLTAEPDGDTACHVSLQEDVSRGPSKVVPKPMRQALIVKRNDEALRRLALLAEGRAGR